MDRSNPRTPRPHKDSGKPIPVAGASEHALIARGAGKWGDSAFPKDGWDFVREQDRGEPDFVCQMCEYKVIRNVQHLRHPSGLHLAAGCVCAGHLTGDLETAKARDRAMKNAAARLAARRDAHDRDWDTLHAISTTGPSALKALEAMKARAVQLARKASADSDIGLDHFELEVDAHCLAHAADKSITAIRERSPAHWLQRALADPDWWETPKGWRFEPSHGDVVQVYQRCDGWRYGYQIRREEMHWSRTAYASPRAAKAAGIAALKRALREAGRLPRSSR